jgi:phage terminase large subunit
MTTGNVNEGCDWATGLAINQRVDAYTWDCDGMGVALNAQTAKAFKGKHTVLSQFKGSETVDNPDAIYDHVEGSQIQGQKTNKQAVKNKRAQYYYELRKRVLRTYEAINGTYHDPDTLISFDSSIDLMPKLRSELCRMPIKPNGNGLFELYTKVDMKGPKFKIESPNLGDSVMMLMRQPHKAINKQYVMPKPPPSIFGKKRR